MSINYDTQEEAPLEVEQPEPDPDPEPEPEPEPVPPEPEIPAEDDVTLTRARTAKGPEAMRLAAGAIVSGSVPVLAYLLGRSDALGEEDMTAFCAASLRRMAPDQVI
ncbi:MAG: hypothetical protein H0V07_06245 [Propionibacteriales bacterium]|nr:hypothetical protein [Propionibacteriales bacterium]